jgi:hypothetical protein
VPLEETDFEWLSLLNWAPVLENTLGNFLNAFIALRGLSKGQSEVVRVTSLEGQIKQ